MYCTGQNRPAQPRATKPVIESKHQLWPGSPDLQFLVGRCRLGCIAYVCIRLECSNDPPKGNPGQLAYTFVYICISIDVSHLYLSISVYYHQDRYTRVTAEKIETEVSASVGKLSRVAFYEVIRALHSDINICYPPQPSPPH